MCYSGAGQLSWPLLLAGSTWLAGALGDHPWLPENKQGREVEVTLAGGSWVAMGNWEKDK